MPKRERSSYMYQHVRQQETGKVVGPPATNLCFLPRYHLGAVFDRVNEPQSNFARVHRKVSLATESPMNFLPRLWTGICCK